MFKCPECGPIKEVKAMAFMGHCIKSLTLDENGLNKIENTDVEFDEVEPYCCPKCNSFVNIDETIEVEDDEAGYFPITSIHREDIVEKFGSAAYNITNEQMEEIAEKMADDYCEQLFWDSMEIIVEHVAGLKPKKG